MTYIEFLPPLRQRSWGWPAVVNLTLGGAGSGFFLLSVFMMVFNPQWNTGAQHFPFQLLAPVIVSIGFLTLTIEAGRPTRAYRLLSNLPNSWMSIESLAGLIFISSSCASYFVPHVLILILAMMAAISLMISQGLMVYRAIAVNVWNKRQIPVIFVTSALMSACGFVLLNTRNGLALNTGTVVVFVAFILFNLLSWLIFLFQTNGRDFRQAVKFLKHPIIMLIVAGIGHMLPFVYLLTELISGNAAHVSLSSELNRMGVGLMLVFGSACQKGGIVVAAGYFRRIITDPLTDKNNNPALKIS